MEWKAFLLPVLVLLSTATLLLFFSQSSNPFSIAKPKQTILNQAPAPVFSSSINRTTSREDEAVCDLFVGKWVEEPRGSTYTNVTCTTIPETRNCGKYGKEQGYVYWKWKPDRCELPRFDPELFLSIARGKKLAFIGDSLARNQMESLLCLLSQAETPTNINNYEYTIDDKFRTWYFPAHDFTLMVRWTEFLVQSEEIMVNGTASNTFNITLDTMNPKWADILPELDYAILNCGNWFSRKTYVYDTGNLIGCVHCRDDDNVTSLSISSALRSVLRAALRHISQCEHCGENLLVMLRTYSASHFEHGQWFTGGYCNRTEPLRDSEVVLGGEVGEFRKVQLEEFERVKGRNKKKRRFELLDVTRAIMLRADGHPGEFLDRRWMKGFSDCLHWCLPGPIDMWNDLLLATMKKNISLD